MVLTLPSPSLHLLVDHTRELPHKTKQGQATLGCLPMSDGIPLPCDEKKRVWFLLPSRLGTEAYMEVCLPRAASYEVGWKYLAVTATLENRKEKAKLRYKKNKQLVRLWIQAKKKRREENW